MLAPVPVGVIFQPLGEVEDIALPDGQGLLFGDDLCVAFDHQGQKMQVAAAAAVGVMLLVEAETEKTVVIR